MASMSILLYIVLAWAISLRRVNCQESAPASIILAPSPTRSSSSTAIITTSSATIIQDSSRPTPQPATSGTLQPSSISRIPQSSTITNPSNTVSATLSGSLAQCTIAFDYSLNFDFVNEYLEAQREIFYYIPRAISYALNLTSSQEVLVSAIIGLSSSSLDFNTTTVMLQIASSLAEPLSNQVSRFDSWLYRRTMVGDDMAKIIAHFNASWPVQQGPAVVLASSSAGLLSLFGTSTSTTSAQPSTLSNSASSRTITTSTSGGSAIPVATLVDQNGGLSDQGKLGIGLGLGFGCAIALSLVIFLIWRRQILASVTSGSKEADQNSNIVTDSRIRGELDSTRPTVELGDTRAMAELETGSARPFAR